MPNGYYFSDTAVGEDCHASSTTFHNNDILNAIGQIGHLPVNRYDITCDTIATAPCTWHFDGSYDGVTWVVLDNITVHQDLVVGTPSSYSFTNENAYLYYRLTMVTTHDGSDVRIRVLDLFVDGVDVTPDMTSAVLPAPYIVTYSTQYSATYAAWKAFDSSTTTYWRGTYQYDWIQMKLADMKVYRTYYRFQLDIPAGAVIDEARMYIYSQGGAGSPTVKINLKDTSNQGTYSATPWADTLVAAGGGAPVTFTGTSATANQWFKSPDIKAMINYFTDSSCAGDYVLGNYIGLCLTADDAAAEVGLKLYASNYSTVILTNTLYPYGAFLIIAYRTTTTCVKIKEVAQSADDTYCQFDGITGMDTPTTDRTAEIYTLAGFGKGHSRAQLRFNVGVPYGAVVNNAYLIGCNNLASAYQQYAGPVTVQLACLDDESVFGAAGPSLYLAYRPIIGSTQTDWAVLVTPDNARLVSPDFAARVKQRVDQGNYDPLGSGDEPFIGVRISEGDADTMGEALGLDSYDITGGGFKPVMVVNYTNYTLGWGHLKRYTGSTWEACSTKEYTGAAWTLPKLWYYKSLAWQGVEQTAKFYPNAHTEVSSVDGYAGRSGVDQTFTNIRAGAGTEHDDEGGILIVQLIASATTNQFQTLRRSAVLFDTSTLPNACILVSATVTLYVLVKGNTLALTSEHAGLVVTGSNPGSNIDLVNSDFANIGSSELSAHIHYDDIVADITGATATVFTLNATGLASISKTSITKLGLQLVVDQSAGTPNWVSGASSLYWGGSAESYKPKLTVVYY